MAKKAYIGVDGIARKIRKGYIGVDGVAKRIKKAYIGIGGVARPCWSGGELTYYGTVTPLSSAVYMFAATSFGGYAWFGGGQTSSGDAMNTVDVYDKSLTKTAAPVFESPKYELSASHTTDYAIFSGGYRGLTHVDAYDNSLTRTTAPKPDVGRYRNSATHTGEFALVAGGFDAYNKVCADVDAYDNSLAKTLPEPLSEARMYIGAATVGNYAIFAGGETKNNTLYPSKAVDVYDQNLTHTTATNLEKGGTTHASVSVGDYALFLKDGEIIHPHWGLYVYDKSLTYTFVSLESFFPSRFKAGATSVEGLAIFAGGITQGSYKKDAFVVDEYLNLSLTTSLSQERQLIEGASVENFALFAGGSNTKTVNTVDAYAVI